MRNQRLESRRRRAGKRTSPPAKGQTDDETGFGEYGDAAGSELARENGDDGYLQRAGRGRRGTAQAESGRRPSGGPDRAWGRAQSRLLLLTGALRLLEERVARAGTADGHVWGKFYD